MGTFILFLLLALNLVLLVLVAALLRRSSGFSQTAGLAELVRESVILRESLLQRFTAATADMAGRLESTKGDLRQGVTDRLTQGFTEIRTTVEAQLSGGGGEQPHTWRGAPTKSNLKTLIRKRHRASIRFAIAWTPNYSPSRTRCS